ncbi:uncharacterized protein LOC133318003 isoform X2 [Gastrolobium bilobum]|uniref:uncharacterized protein LOC133318003 isoform X2 n=1 Tax=Gastrolobium bilobum TaxID=150636 RepID=UPI002AAF32AB|nr:uncharacterized protein LOC133318003 isoform X2 [Gastrolobium bilobum]
MGSDLEMNDKSEEAALEKENIAVPATAFSESEEQKVVLRPGTNCKGIEQTPVSCGNEEDVQVNIVGSGCISSGGKVVEDACDDFSENESSSYSSFGDTDTGSDVENASGSAFSNAEDELPMFDVPLQSRKKKVTDHWRRFIQPIRWRCKWLELQLKRLNSQAQKYNKELAAYDYRKKLEFSKFTVDGCGVKSVPISDGFCTDKVMKRKKRKRDEECDLSSYLSNHSIFSYYENKDRAHGACLEDFGGVATMKSGDNADNLDEFQFKALWSSVDHEDNKSLDDIIETIEAVMSQVQKLKTRVDNVVSENPGKFCSVTQLSMIRPSNGFNHFGHNSATFAGNGNTMPVSFVHASSQLKSEPYMEDVLTTENTLSTREGITPFIETTNRPLREVPWGNLRKSLMILNMLEISLWRKPRNQLKI